MNFQLFEITKSKLQSIKKFFPTLKTSKSLQKLSGKIDSWFKIWQEIWERLKDQMSLFTKTIDLKLRSIRMEALSRKNPVQTKGVRNNLS